MEIYELKERKLIKEVVKQYKRWEQAEITDLDFFIILKEIAEKGIKVINESVEIQAEKYLQDAQLQKLDREDLERDKREFERKEQEYYIEQEVKDKIRDIKENKKLA
ncbi:MAG: hypothetical protein ACOC56_04440 [Atribacterota bacterium]